MKEDKKKNIIIALLTAIIILLLILITLIYSKNTKENNIDNQNNSKENTTDNIENKDVLLTSFINDVTGPLGWLFVLSEAPESKGEKELLLSSNDKELFVMEYILKDENNFKDFIVLDAVTGEKIDGSPTQEVTNVYYPYNLFNEVYKKFFNTNFDVKDKIRAAGGENEYDNSDDYLYYPNRRPGRNGLSITKMNVISNNYDEQTKKYTADINMIYSERLAEQLGSKSSNAKLVYTIENGNIIMESFTRE